MNYKDVYLQWLNDPMIDDATKAELNAIAGNEKEIEDRFFKELDFGTGGLRGVIGAGTNRLNIYTVRKATQGLANYILSSDVYQSGMAVAIAHDCRRMSPEFSEEAALVLNANGIHTYVFDALRPTPMLSFSVRELGCVAGIVVTASHNPPEYNGYKVYWSDGGQVPYPRDEAIITEVNKVSGFDMVKTMKKDAAVAAGLFQMVPPAVDDAFIKHVMAQSIHPEVIKDSGLKIVYTPLHGSGNIPVRRALQEIGFKNVYVVKEQELPDGNFPTVSYPNPEDEKAFECALKLAAEKDADIVVATDPDCDRVGFAIKVNGTYQLLTGNQTGVILTEYILSQKQQRNELPANAAVVSTIVSTNMTHAIADHYGAAYKEVLTGFKYIGEQIKQFEATGSNTYLFGFEESYGYLAGTYARDKDAVAATTLVCEAAAFYAKQGKTLLDALHDLYAQYGIYLETIASITLKGVDGIQDIQKIMTALRENTPKTLGGAIVITKRDYKISKFFDLVQGDEKPITLPVSDVLYFTNKDGSWACVRPSGTEPKIKLYFGIQMPIGSTMDAAKERLDYMVTDLKSIVDRALNI